MSEAPSNEATIFNAARKINSSDDQAAYLKEACGKDSGLQQRVEKLLSAYLEESQFLKKPAAELEATVLPENSRGNLAESLEAGLAASFGEEEAVVIGRANHSVLRTLGQTIDLPRVALRDSIEEGPDSVIRPKSSEMPITNPDSRYRLDGEIARGGMGAIIKGRDTDLGRDLAIKVLLDDHKDKPEIVQRFVEEAQIGGQLQHPGIAPIYELGQFADKRPFFAMKLVKGKTLSAILSERENANADRGKLLGIFEQMCQTMAYAHSRGVIHRDLKPANIMVGAFGEVQVMDWGLAKVLPTGGVADEKKAHTKLNDVSIIQTLRSVGSDAPGTFGTQGSETQMGSVMGTPAYMPPEQALGEIDHLDERADVFGLGAILCEILTGQPPYVGTDGNSIYRQAARGKLGDCFERLDACEADVELIALTKHCLELEPEDRPRDAGVLAEQVVGYLESVENKLRETERAKADALIRTEELRRRNKLAITAGTAIVAVLVIGISFSVWQAVRATNAETLARNETVRATNAEGVAKVEAARAVEAEKKTAETLVQVAAERDAKELARKEAEAISKFLSKVFQSADPARDGRTITVAETLGNAVGKLETELADQPAQRAKLQATLGKTYFTLGLYHEAIPLQEKVRDYYFTNFGTEDSNTHNAMRSLSNSYDREERKDEALKIREDLMKIRKDLLEFRTKTYGPEHPLTLELMQTLAHLYSQIYRPKEAFELQEKILTLKRKLHGPEHPSTLNAMRFMADYYVKTGHPDKACEMVEKMLPLCQKLYGDESGEVIQLLVLLSNSYSLAGQPEKGRELREQIVAIGRKIYGPEHYSTLGYMRDLAHGYLAEGRLDEGLKLLEAVLTLRRKVLGPEHFHTLMTLEGLAITYFNAGQHQKALELQEEKVRLSRKSRGDEHPHTLQSMIRLVGFYSLSERQKEALELQEEVLKLQSKVLGPEHPDTLRAMNKLVSSYYATGRPDEALEMHEETLELDRMVLGPEHPSTLNTMKTLATSYGNAGRRDEALEMLEELLELYRKISGPEHSDTLNTMNTLVTSYDIAGRRDEALEMLIELLELYRKISGPEHSDTLNTMNTLVTSYGIAGRPDEALEMLEELLELYRKVSGPEHPDTLSAMRNLAISYSNLGFQLDRKERTEEAIDAWRKAIELNPKIKSNAPFYLGVLLERSGKSGEAFTAYLTAIRNGVMRQQAHDKTQMLLKDLKNLDACVQAVKSKPELSSTAFTIFASAGRTVETLPLLAEYSADNPGDTFLAMKTAALQVWFSKDAEYLATRERMLKWAKDATKPGEFKRVAKLSCISPISNDEMRATVLALAQRAVEIGPEHKDLLPYFQVCLGMAEYRSGHYAMANNGLSTAAEILDNGTIKGTANFYRAMSLFQQGKPDEARTLFNQAEATMKPLPTDEKNPLADDADKRDLIMWLAYKEAKALLGETGTSDE
ncbi:MAG: hypothetical protein COA78_02350 [Blastopirellula sp.]|nr:MAG: hypothetical protein COA78_02350 [Blastopirellula sp.]